MQFIGSLVFTGFLFAWTFLVAVVFVSASVFMPFRKRFWFARFWGHSTLKVLKWTCGLTYVVEGRENLPRDNHIAFWKHSSSWETVAMSAIFPRQVWVLKRELQWIPIVGWGIRQLHAIAIDRRSGHVAVSQVVEQGKQRLAEGDWIIIFPEGTRMAPGETRRYGVSGALLAAETARLIIPVAHNAGYFWPRRGWLKKRGIVRVVIGAPIVCDGRDPREINEEVQDWIERQVQRLAPSDRSIETSTAS
ncbi:MAG TPA: lysophospholipid acyltransferase family protein [Steroidobacteraceae bacterium]|nr:lysophospholipid acyltransferase family protein [Steroidobacteraceae bacterium]